MIRYIVFDFDGTLVDSRQLFIDSYNTIAARNNYRLIEEETLFQLQPMSVTERCRHLNVPLIKLPKMGYDFLKLYRNSTCRINLYPGIKDLLQNLSGKGYKLGIISSNSKDIIKDFLQKNEIFNIDAILCSSNILGKSRILRRFLKLYKLQPDEMLYVGDEQRDIVACKTVNVKIAAVTWGYDNSEVLLKMDPDYLLTSPSEVAVLFD